MIKSKQSIISFLKSFNPQFVFWFLLMSALFYYRAGWKGILFGIWLLVLSKVFIVGLIKIIGEALSRQKDVKQNKIRLALNFLFYLTGIPFLFYLVILLLRY